MRTLIAPSRDGGWMSQFVYASHLVRTPEGELRLYFNARNRADLFGTEHIGFAFCGAQELAGAQGALSRRRRS